MKGVAALASAAFLAISAYFVVTHTSIDSIVLGVYAAGASHGLIAAFLLKWLLSLQSRPLPPTPTSSEKETAGSPALCATPRTLLRGLVDEDDTAMSTSLVLPSVDQNVVSEFTVEEYESMKKQQKNRVKGSPADATSLRSSARRSSRTPKRYSDFQL
jgi:hypothetical protein